MAEIATTEPVSIHAGETIKFKKSLPNYPAGDGWAVVYKFRGASAGYDATATADGDAHVVTVPASTTANWAGGMWVYQAWASKSGESYLVTSDQINVVAALPNSSTVVDPRSNAKRILDAIDAMMLGKATLDQQEYQIGTRMLKRIPITELIELRKTYAKLVAGEIIAANVAAGKPKMKTILARFDTPQ